MKKIINLFWLFYNNILCENKFFACFAEEIFANKDTFIIFVDTIFANLIKERYYSSIFHVNFPLSSLFRVQKLKNTSFFTIIHHQVNQRYFVLRCFFIIRFSQTPQ